MQIRTSLCAAASVLLLVTIPAAVADEPPAAAPATALPSGADKPSPLSMKQKFKVETVVESLEVPWAMVFRPGSGGGGAAGGGGGGEAGAPDMFITERRGRVRLYAAGKLDPKPYFEVPGVKTGRGEIGLMGICLHPDYTKNKYVYLSFGHTDGDVRVVRYKDTGTTLEEDKVIMKGAPAGVNHAGCAIAFGPDKKLYITTGEMFKRQLAQDMSSLGGKTLRVNDDGTIPEDNPFVGKKDARPEIWSLGHRNAQGIDWQPGSNLMFQSEHGPSGEAGTGGDEVNIVEKGKNYGWPTIHHRTQKEGLEPPIVEWSPAIAPASGRFYAADVFPELKGNFLVGALVGESLWRIVLDGRKVVCYQKLIGDEYGRIRAVVQGPDGLIYFTTSNRDGRGRPAKTDDRVLRIVPVSGG